MALVAPDGLNHWISNRDYAFARWWWYFDSSKTLARDQVMHFARVYEVVAEETGILRPMIKSESGEFIPLKAATGLSFSEHLEKRLNQQGETGKYEPIPPVVYPTRIAFYDENADIVERAIDELEPLLMKLRPDKADDSHAVRHYMYPEPPVDARGELEMYRLLQYGQRKFFEHHEKLPPGKKAIIACILPTDIWFGKVIGWMEDSDPDDEDRWFDNLDLAERHTPRLNQFIQTMNAVFHEIEGAWEREEAETLIRYRPLITENGITLD